MKNIETRWGIFCEGCEGGGNFALSDIGLLCQSAAFLKANLVF